MTNYLLLSFGEINLGSLNGEYETVIHLAEKKGKEAADVKVDINFAKTTIEEADMDVVKSFVENIPIFDKQNRAFMTENFDDEEGQIDKYTDFHLEEIDNEFLEKIGIDSTQSKSNQQKQFLKNLKLARVGLYPDGKYNSNAYAVFDYTTNPDLSDQLLVANTDSKGVLKWIGWES